jgi:hypothetical protein
MRSATQSAEMPRLDDGSEQRWKAFFVGDNRTTVNWGRGASIALAQTLSGVFDITSRLTGNYFEPAEAHAMSVGALLPARSARILRRLWTRNKQRAAWLGGAGRLLWGADFISENPSVSVDRLVHNVKRNPAFEEIYRRVSEADLLVVDGDGDIIFSNPPRRQTLFLLAMIELGLRLGKPVFLVNSMISDCPVTGRNEATLRAARTLLAGCRAVALRDPESLEYVRKEMPEANSFFIPDSLFAWRPYYSDVQRQLPHNGDFLLPHPEKDAYWGRLDFSEPYICVGGGAMAANRPDQAVQSYTRLARGLAELGLKVYLTENDAPDSFLVEVARNNGFGIIPADAPILLCGAVLANARLFISGRYHPSIFASLGGTPCIFLDSHAHKMGSLAHVLEYEDPRTFEAFPGQQTVAQILSIARDYLKQGEALRARIRRIADVRCEQATSLPAFLLAQMASGGTDGGTAWS